MWMLGLGVVLSVSLGGGFGEATAEIVDITDDVMNVRVEVEVITSADAVVMHLIAPGEPDLTLPLLPAGEGVYVIQTDLRPIDYQVVFEAIGTRGALSRPVSLSSMGAVFSGPATAPASEPDGLSPESARRGWLALALGAASLSALAFWALGERSNRKSDDDEDGVDERGDDVRDVDTAGVGE